MATAAAPSNNLAPYLRLRQICLVAHDLEKVAADLTETLGLEICHRDPNVAKYGLKNVLMPIGTNFLEVVSPMKPGPETAAGRYLERRKGDGGYMVIMDCDDVAPWRAHMGTVGVRLVEDRAYEGKAHLMQFHPRDTGACIMEIDHHIGGDNPNGPYQWAGDHWHKHIRTDRAVEIAGVVLQANAPEALAQRWAQILKRAPHPDYGAIFLDNAAIDFAHARDGRGDGLAGIGLAVKDKAAILATAKKRGLAASANAVTICGTRFEFVAAE
jgi:Glyoxalase-like domain